METITEKYIEYLTNVRRFKPSSLVDYRAALKHVKNAGVDPLKLTSRGEVRAVISKIAEERRWSAASSSKNSKCLKNFYDWAHSERLIDHNPYPFNEFKRERPVEPPYLEEAHYKRIIADMSLSHQDRTLAMVLWDTGIRRAELATISRSEVNLEKGVIHIPREKSKGKYSNRYIPVSRETNGMLAVQIMIASTHGTGHDALFLTKWKTPLDKRDVSEIIGRVGRSSALKVTPHMFRHSFGVRMLKAGVPQLVVMHMLGHASATQTNHYLHMNEDEAIHFYPREPLHKTA